MTVKVRKMLRSFRKLNRETQLKLLHGCGIFLMECKGHRVVMQLFQFYTFYVEIICDIIHRKVIMINAFDDTELLHPYLDQIDISELALPDGHRNGQA